MYTLAFLLTTLGSNGAIIEVHGAFENAGACEYAAGIVEQNEHPLKDGMSIVCIEAELS